MNNYLAAFSLAVVQAGALAQAPEAPVGAAVVATPGGCEAAWPASSVRNQETGTVDMVVLVQPDGRASDVRIVRSSGYRDLDRAAVAAVAKCQYEPAQRDGAAVPAWFELSRKWLPPQNKMLPVANFASCAKPVWPKESLRKEEQGTVQLGFLIGVDGAVRESRVEKSSGYPLLDLAALDAIGRCRFSPGTENGKPVENWTRMRYVWAIEGPSPQQLADKLAKAREGALAGAAQHQYQLGQMYLNGQGVPQDFTEARKWLEKSAEQGYADAQEALGMILLPRANAPGDPALATIWLRKAAEQGKPTSQYVLSNLLRQQGDNDNALVWLRRAAEKQPAAQTALALTLMTSSAPEDRTEAIKLLTSAAAQNERNAQVKLAECYEKGLGVKQDYAQAATLYERAAASGNRVAQLSLAHLYEEGLGVPQDAARAQQLLQQAGAPK
jgi:TonB family protein